VAIYLILLENCLKYQIKEIKTIMDELYQRKLSIKINMNSKQMEYNKKVNNITKE
jgi:hypothetical protein